VNATAAPDASQEWDACFWEPGGKVLRNKLDLHNFLELRLAEYRYRAVRQGEIERGEVDIPRTFDRAHLQAIHRHLLQDVYDWAGTFRTVGIRKNGKDFVPPERIGEIVDLVGEKLIRNQDWAAMNRQEFVANVANIYCLQNIAHPFREGNGATAKVYLAHVAELSRFRLDFDRVDKWDWDQASEAAYPRNPLRDAPDPTKMYAVFDKVTLARKPATPVDPGLAKVIALQNTTYGVPHRAGTGERPETHRARGTDQGTERHI
jgi:cell filamentation protein